MRARVCVLLKIYYKVWRQVSPKSAVEVSWQRFRRAGVAVSARKCQLDSEASLFALLRPSVD